MELPRAHVDGCLSHRNLRHLLEKDADAWWGDWGAGKKVLHDFAARVTSQPISIGAAERCWKAYAPFTVQSGTALGRSGIRNWSECTITFVAVRRKRSNPDFEDVHLAAMTIDPIDEAADDLIVEDDSDSDY